MKNTAITTFLLLCGFILLTSAPVLAQRDDLSGKRWKLIDASGKEVNNSAAHFEINTDHSRFTGNTGCNQMFGTVSIRGSRIAFSNIGTTKRACKLMPGSLPEHVFLGALKSVARYNQKRDRLDLMDTRGRTVLKFQVEGASDDVDAGAARLGDKKWALESIKNRKTFVAIKGVFVNFDPAKRSAGGNTGCNVFGGSYEASAKTIAIKDIISTMRACTEGNKMQLEREFLAGLRNAARYEIRDGRLFLYRGTQLLLTLCGEPK